MNSQAITSVEYWDKRWQNSIDSIRVIKSNHHIWGSNGIYARVMRRRLGHLRDKQILELGGGGLNYSALIAAKWMGAQMFVVDYSPASITCIKKLFNHNDCSLTTFTGDFFEIDYPIRTFDIVTHFGVIEHFTDIQPIIDLSATLTKTGGATFFTMPNMTCVGAYWWKKWSLQNWSTHIFQSTASVKGALHRAGFSNIKTFHFGLPGLQMSAWQQRGILQSSVTLCQQALNTIEHIIPIYHLGTRWFSSMRGFVATKEKKS
jgi:2-polyprenyl-3-methyl-5-hydroxy-6-metoxy-1,4-benzoquinol methylase